MSKHEGARMTRDSDAYDQTKVDLCISGMLRAARASGANLLELETASRSINVATREKIKTNVERARSQG